MVIVDMNAPLFIASDHGGFAYKQQLVAWLEAEEIAVTDLGPTELNPDDDYPDFALPLAERIAAEDDDEARGILLCRSGGGMVIAANKVKGIRAVAVTSEKEAEHAREHNNANVISIAADWTSLEDAKAAIKTFLLTPFAGGRHQRRLEKIAAFEEQCA